MGEVVNVKIVALSRVETWSFEDKSRKILNVGPHNWHNQTTPDNPLGIQYQINGSRVDRCPKYTRIQAKLIVTRPSVVAGISLLAILALLASAPLIARAQQGENQTFEQTAGPYRIEAVMVESTLSLGTVILFITVTDEATGNAVPDARVSLRTKHEPSDKEGTATAHNTPQTPERYDAQLNLNFPGEWRITLEITSSLGTVGVEMPPVDVPAMQQFSSGTIVFAVVFGILFLGTAYLWWNYRRKRHRSMRPRSPE